MTPGVAYDSFGRELILECAADVEIPNGPVAKGKKRFLIVRYKKPGSRQMTDPLAAVCCVAGGPTSAGNVEFVWLDAPQFTTGGGVPLGHLTYLDRAVPKFVAFVATQKVRPLARPRIGTGSTIPGNTSWQPWTFDMPLLRGIVFSAELGVQTTVDTSAAGFTEIPQYFAWIEGSIWNAQTMQLVPAILPSIDNEALDSFTFRLILMPQPVAPQLLELAPRRLLLQKQLILCHWFDRTDARECRRDDRWIRLIK